MNYSVSIFLSAPALQAIQDQSDRQIMLYKKLLQEEEAIASLLQSYHFASRERVFGIEPEEASMIVNTEGLGSFRVKYMIGTSNACADIDYSQTVSMLISLQISPETGEAVLAGEDIYERDPDEF